MRSDMLQGWTAFSSPTGLMMSIRRTGSRDASPVLVGALRQSFLQVSKPTLVFSTQLTRQATGEAGSFDGVT